MFDEVRRFERKSNGDQRPFQKRGEFEKPDEQGRNLGRIKAI
jgi:hypothetical protein